MLEEIKIKEEKGVMVVSSREISLNFEKRHSDVLEKIESLMREMNSTEKSVQYFILNNYKDDSGKSNKEYLLTRDGFSLLVMGFNGSKALKWKLKYIEAFNNMEEYIKTKQKSTLDIQSKNADARLKNAKVKEANFILDTLEKYGLSNISKELLVINALEVVLGENTLPRPKLEEKYYTATEIANEIGVSANAVGKISNQNNLKTEEYGIEVLDKSRYSNKQVPTFRYNEKGRSKLLDLFKNKKCDNLRTQSHN